jgi:hypothetical protein
MEVFFEENLHLDDEYLPKVFKLYRNLFDRLKYRSLAQLKRPYIYAYTSLVNLEVIQKAQSYGFDNVINAPMTVTTFEKIGMSKIKELTNEFIQNNLPYEIYQEIQALLSKSV